MADLGYTQAQWTALLGLRFVFAVLSPLRLLDEFEDRFRRSREQVRIDLSTATYFDSSVGDLTVSGAIPGVNCQPDGTFYVRFTGNSGARVVSLYSATGASGLVAQGSAADGAVATLAAQNSSGVTGTWPIPSSSGNTTADELTVQAVRDYPGIVRSVYDGSSPHADDDPYAADVMTDAYTAVANTIASAKIAFLSRLVRAFLTDGTKNPIALGNAFTTTSWAAFLIEIAKETDGAVTRPRTGWIPSALRAGMDDETTGGAQSVVKIAPTGAAGVFDSDNVGLGSVASHTPDESCPEARFDFYCARGAENGNIGNEGFRAQITYLRAGDEQIPTPVDRLLTVKQPWKGPLGFGSITLARTLSKTNDGSNNNFVAATSATVTGETNDNTDSGDLHINLEDAGGGNWNVYFYKSSAMASSDLVSQALAVASGAAFTTSPQNNGPTITWQLGGTESAVSNIVLELNPFREDRGDGEPDHFSVTVSHAAGGGLIQRLVAQHFGARLASATSGSETIEEGYAKAFGFHPLAVDDN